MSRDRFAEVEQRAGVATPDAAVETLESSRIADSLREEICRRPVVFIDELATLLGTSDRTIRRQLRMGSFFIPEAPKVDHRHRWSRARVYAAIAEETVVSHRQRLLGPRRVGKPERLAK